MTLPSPGPSVLAKPEGFREYDLRWRYPEEVNLPGLRALGLAFGTWLHENGHPTQVVTGHDWRAYAPEVQEAVIDGLVAAGCRILDLGLALSPMVYFAQAELGGIAGAMITASHNPNGWTGVKLSAAPPLTVSPDDIRTIQSLTLSGGGRPRPGGSRTPMPDIPERYLADLAGQVRLSSPLRVVCATGNGAAGAFAPQLLARIGCEVVPRHVELDDTYPHYNPNPESERMLADMGEAVRESGAALGLGFDGDGDRCGAVDEAGQPVYADKIGLLLARDLATAHPGRRFLVDVKSTGLFRQDPVLRSHGCEVTYVRTGHYYMKQALLETGALCGFERSGHFFFAPPLGRGYDDGLRAAVAIGQFLDRAGAPLSALVSTLPPTWTTPTLQPACADATKYATVERATRAFQQMQIDEQPVAGLQIREVETINGARLNLEGGSWALLRASSNTPNLVLVVESPNGEEEMREILHSLQLYLLDHHPEVGGDVSGNG